MEKEDSCQICCFFVIDFYHIHSSCWIVRERLYEELIHLVEIEVFFLIAIHTVLEWLKALLVKAVWSFSDCLKIVYSNQFFLFLYRSECTELSKLLSQFVSFERRLSVFDVKRHIHTKDFTSKSERLIVTLFKLNKHIFVFICSLK